MKIELEEPFKSKWNNGYTYVDSENRKRVTFYNSKSDISKITGYSRTTVSKYWYQ